MLYGEQIREYEENGFFVVRGATEKSLIDKFISEREPRDYELNSEKVSHDNFLDGRTEFYRNRWILDVLFQEKVLSFFEKYKIKFVLQLVEARIGTSGIPWHIDSLEPRSDFSPEYVGVHVALEQALQEAGRFEIIKGSHRWDIDSQIINKERCAEFWKDCYSYYEEVISMKEDYEIYSFDSIAGDAIIWNGKSFHRGERAKDGFFTRRSIFGHLVSVTEKEQEMLMTKDGQKIEKFGPIYILASDADKED